MAEAFRSDLELAKIGRAELFERSKTRLPIRIHDLRATFVTLALAAGKSEGVGFRITPATPLQRHDCQLSARRPHRCRA